MDSSCYQGVSPQTSYRTRLSLKEDCRVLVNLKAWQGEVAYKFCTLAASSSECVLESPPTSMMGECRIGLGEGNGALNPLSSKGADMNG